MKIECPSCRRIMEVDDAQGGKQVSCPACAQPIVVPQLRTPVEARLAPQKCPACERLVPGGAAVCMYCGVVVATGEPLPATERVDEVPGTPEAEGRRHWGRAVKLGMGIG